MAIGNVEPGGLGAGENPQGGIIEPTVWAALPYFISLLVFPLVMLAATHGGWWLLGPAVYFMLAGWFDKLFGTETRNMDPDHTLESQLILYKLAIWAWAMLWLVTLVYALWQILVAGHLALWESLLMAIILALVGQAVFIAGHELIHQRALWERRLGELLLASVSYPIYATEHIYVHHALVCTPADHGTAIKGQSFWQYLPKDMASSLLSSWRFERSRLARRHLPVWHYSNPFWRYGLETAGWYLLVYWMGGIWAVLVFALFCSGIILSMKIINYVQHYGLQRIRLPNGRFERVAPRHSWSAASKFTNWIYYNMQRHADHHIEATRYYPLLQFHGEEESPQLPKNYSEMAGLAVFPKRWFELMDPMVDRWRACFYPHINDWSAYDSPAFVARPESIERIQEILEASPRLSEWINAAPELLDCLEDREFTDLDLPDGFGPDTGFETVARKGLARLYWTHEFGVGEMTEQLSELPAQGEREKVETVRNWLNDKVFQVSMHVMRGSLSPVEAGPVFTNLAQASISVLLVAVEDEYRSTSRRARRARGEVAAVLLGEAASGEAVPGCELEVAFVYEGTPPEYYRALCARFYNALRAFSHENLLFIEIPCTREVPPVRSLEEFSEYHRTSGTASELQALMQARCVFAPLDSGLEVNLDKARCEVLTHGTGRLELLDRLSSVTGDAPGAGLASIDTMHGGLHDLENAARWIQLTHAEDALALLVPDTASVFETAGGCGLMEEDAAARLAEAARLWRNIRGALQLVVGHPLNGEDLGPKVQAAIARSSGQDDFHGLSEVIREGASRTALDLGALDGWRASDSSPVQDAPDQDSP